MITETELEKLHEALATGTSILFPTGCASIITESWEQLGFHSHTVQMALLGYRSRDAELTAKDAEIARLRAHLDALEVDFVLRSSLTEAHAEIARLKAGIESLNASILRSDELYSQWESQRNELSTLKQDKAKLVEGMRSIANMAHYDQDDAHRLRYTASLYLAKHGKENL